MTLILTLDGSECSASRWYRFTYWDTGRILIGWLGLTSGSYEEDILNTAKFMWCPLLLLLAVPCSKQRDGVASPWQVIAVYYAWHTQQVGHFSNGYFLNDYFNMPGGQHELWQVYFSEWTFWHCRDGVSRTLQSVIPNVAVRLRWELHQIHLKMFQLYLLAAR
jgi:hypothetical protein